MLAARNSFFHADRRVQMFNFCFPDRIIDFRKIAKQSPFVADDFIQINFEAVDGSFKGFI